MSELWEGPSLSSLPFAGWSGAVSGQSHLSEVPLCGPGLRCSNGEGSWEPWSSFVEEGHYLPLGQVDLRVAPQSKGQVSSEGAGHGFLFSLNILETGV